MTPLPADAPADIRRIEDRLPFQRRTWRIQRIGWAAMALVVLAALSGATGRGGPLAEAETVTPDGALRIRYERMQRLGAPTLLRLEARAGAANRDGAIELRLDPAFLRDWRLRPGVPVPEAAAAGPDGLRLRFRAAPGAARVAVMLELMPERAFLVARPAIALGDGPPARPLILVWP
ncbi:hypothetical protein [Caldovatus aquaticus]|uniref:Uncharacterized protein n=1 Tax=Caldovatus aquaticus TaxID=2865671 RepID=A0ABS7F003_9PROT|nr:hypothetical protein [Caldovatus aquaticus]MBW8268947.1 hypothetical protein [Caldovatus aquaticus]